MAVNPMLVGGIGVGVTAAAVTGGLYAGGVIGGSSSNSDKSLRADKSTNNEETNWQSISQGSEASSYDNKWGGTYKKYLVGTDAKNNDWWAESLAKLKEAQGELTSKKFNDIKTPATGAQTKTIEDLKNACKAAYGADKANVNAAGEKGNENKFKEEEVWTYCSPSTSGKIKTVKEGFGTETNTYTGTKYGKTLEDSAASTSNNDWFWDQRQKEYDEAASTANRVDMKGKKVKQWCQEAYDIVSNPPSATNPSSENITKWCTISGS